MPFPYPPLQHHRTKSPVLTTRLQLPVKYFNYQLSPDKYRMSFGRLVYPSNRTIDYPQINISNYNYGRYSDASFYRSPCSSSSSSSHVAKTRNATKDAKKGVPEAYGTEDPQQPVGDGDERSDPQDTADPSSSSDRPAEDTGSTSPAIASNNSITTRSISKTYQKYRTLLSLPKKTASSTSLATNSVQTSTMAANVNRHDLMSLPDEILSLIISFVYVQLENESTNGQPFSFFRSPFNYKIYTNSNLNHNGRSNPAKKQAGKNVSFRLISGSTNRPTTLPLNSGNRASTTNNILNETSSIPRLQKKIERPIIQISEYSSPTCQKRLTNYINTILQNYKMSIQNYTNFPHRTLLCLIYTNKRLHSLTIPFLYRDLKFRSSYRLSQFVSTIRKSPKLGIFVQSINFENLDTLYYFVIDPNDKENGYMLLSEKEKNKLEHLINDEIFQDIFDGTFPKEIDMSQVPVTRINVKEYISTNKDKKLPILFMHDERHSIIPNPTNNNTLIELGVKPRLAICGWREWKLRDDPLYQTSKVSVDWVTQNINNDIYGLFHTSGISVVVDGITSNIYHNHHHHNNNNSGYLIMRSRSSDSLNYNHSINDESTTRRQQHRRGSIGNLSLISIISSRTNTTAGTSTPSLSIFSNLTNSSSMSSFSSLENHDNEANKGRKTLEKRMRKKFRLKSKMKHKSKKIVNKLRYFCLDPDSKSVEVDTKLNTKVNAGQRGGNLSNMAMQGNNNNTTASSSRNATELSFHTYPLRNKSLMKYSAKDIPLGHILHILDICQNLKEVKLDRLLIADDYLINNDYSSRSGFPLFDYCHNSGVTMTSYRPLTSCSLSEQFDFECINGGDINNQVVDHNIYLSDVSKFNHWNDDKLIKLKVNECIFSRLNKLAHLNSLSMSRLRWITTGDVLQMLKENKSVTLGGLKWVNFKDSGMQRELKWAVEGSVEYVWRKFYNEREQEMLSLSRRIGREY